MVCGEEVTTTAIKCSKCSLFIHYNCNERGVTNYYKKTLKTLNVTFVNNLTFNKKVILNIIIWMKSPWMKYHLDEIPINEITIFKCEWNPFEWKTMNEIPMNEMILGEIFSPIFTF